MAPIKIELEGKIYTIDFSNLTTEQVKRLKQIESQMIAYRYEALEIITGVKKEELCKLEMKVVNKLFNIVAEENEKRIRKIVH